MTTQAIAASRPVAGAATLAGGPAGSTPPLLLSGEHFAAATFFLLTGAVGLYVIAPDLAAGFYLSPRVAAVTHLFTLGWITTSIMGALYQLLPVALDQPVRSVKLAHATFALYVPGVPAFVAGLWFGWHGVMLSGAVVFAAGVVLFLGNLAATLLAAKVRDVTWWALALAGLFLGVTLVLGLALAGNLRWGFLGGARLLAMGVHLHVALAGWVLLVMIGVAHRLLPMFLLSHGAGDRFTKAAVALVATGAGMLAVLHHAPPLFSRWLPALLIGAGCAAFLLQARSFFARRVRPGIDSGMRLAAAALVILALGLVLAWPVLLGAGPPRLAVAYIAAVILGISLFIAAHYYKIVPFLVWIHRFGPLAGRREVPRIADLYSARAAAVAGGAFALGALGLIGSIAAGAAVPARVAAALFAGGAVIEGVQLFRLWRIRP